jgi:hypothetical protein
MSEVVVKKTSAALLNRLRGAGMRRKLDRPRDLIKTLTGESCL